MQRKVSIIIPIYNVEKYLERCIQSVLVQTYGDFELILINDGSTDRSDSICKKFQERDSRIVYFRQENAGVSCARNRGIDLASGCFITFVDADDWLDPNFLEKLLIAQEQHGADLTSCEHIDIGKESSKCSIRRVFPAERYAEGEDFTANIIPKIFYNNGGQPLCDPYCHLLKKEILDSHHIRFDETLKLREGRLFNFTYAQHCSRFSYIPEPLYYRLLRDGSALHVYRKNIYQECKSVCTAYMRLLQRYGQLPCKDAHFCIDVLIHLVFYSSLKYPEYPRRGRALRNEYYGFLMDSPMKELWEHVSLSQCGDIKEFIEVICVKLHIPNLLKWIYWLRMKWTSR